MNFHLLDWQSVPPWSHPIWGFALFAVGCCVGSFLNVCVYRCPLGASIVRPRSRCASCGVPLRTWQNLPILGWWLQRGWCGCGLTRIDARYWLVELGTGVLYLLLWSRCSGALFVVQSIVLGGLVVTALIDLDHYIILDGLSLGGLVLGLVASAIVPELHHTPAVLPSVMAATLGALTGALLLGTIAWLGRLALRKEAMGQGDIKLLAAIGAFQGWVGVLYAVAVGSLLGSLIGLLFLRRGPLRPGLRLPFGTFLCAAAISWMLGGETLARWYLSLLWTPGGGDSAP